MKGKSILSILIALGLFITSCSKCMDCTQTITTVIKTPGLKDSTEVIQRNLGELCNDDLEKVDGTIVTQESSNGSTKYFTTIETTCK